MDLIRFNEIVYYEGMLDFDTAFSKAESLTNDMPENDTYKNEYDFLYTRTHIDETPVHTEGDVPVKELELPKKFEDVMIRLLGEEDYSVYKESLSRPIYKALRVNTGKISVEDFQKLCPFHLSPIPWTRRDFIMMKKRMHLHGILFTMQAYIICRSHQLWCRLLSSD